MKRVTEAVKKYQKAKSNYLAYAEEIVAFIKEHPILQLICKDKVLALLSNIHDDLLRLQKPKAKE